MGVKLPLLQFDRMHKGEVGPTSSFTVSIGFAKKAAAECSPHENHT